MGRRVWKPTSRRKVQFSVPWQSSEAQALVNSGSLRLSSGRYGCSRQQTAAGGACNLCSRPPGCTRACFKRAACTTVNGRAVVSSVDRVARQPEAELGGG